VRSGQLTWQEALRFWTCVNALRLQRLIANRHHDWTEADARCS